MHWVRELEHGGWIYSVVLHGIFIGNSILLLLFDHHTAATLGARTRIVAPNRYPLVQGNDDDTEAYDDEADDLSDDSDDEESSFPTIDTYTPACSITQFSTPTSSSRVYESQAQSM